MEQKKILWVVLGLSVFILVIFGFALFLSAPSHKNAPELQQAVAVKTPTPPVEKGIIPPQSFSQNNEQPPAESQPGTTAPAQETKAPASPDAPQTPASGSINLTIVNGDNTGATYGTVDVSGLTRIPPQAKPPANNPEPMGTDTIAPKEKQEEDTVRSSDSKKLASNTEKKSESASATSETEKQAPKTASKTVATKPIVAKAVTQKAEPKKVAPKKTITVIEYWIQTGSFSSKLNAEKARDALVARYLNAEIFTKETAGETTYRVRVGPYKTKNEAEYWLGSIKGISVFSGSYISEVKVKK